MATTTLTSINTRSGPKQWSRAVEELLPVNEEDLLCSLEAAESWLKDGDQALLGSFSAACPTDEDWCPDRGRRHNLAASLFLIRSCAFAQDFSPAAYRQHLLQLGLPDVYCERVVELAQVQRRQGSHPDEQDVLRSWSLDVAISSSRTFKLLQPRVRLTFRDDESGSDRQLVLDADQFGELRYLVAEALKTMQSLQRRKVLDLQPENSA